MSEIIKHEAKNPAAVTQYKGSPAEKWEEAVDRRFIWLPNTGDFVCGLFCGVRVESYDGEDKKILDIDPLEHNLTIEQAKEKHCSMFFKGNLYRRVMSLSPKPGDKLEITFEGKVQRSTKYGDREENQFRVRISRK